MRPMKQQHSSSLVAVGIALCVVVGFAVRLAGKTVKEEGSSEVDDDDDDDDDDENDVVDDADEDAEEDERHYFKAYANNIEITRQMLTDETRTLAYAKAIALNPLIRGGVVLDVGCGTGILSVFAALAGARKVYAVEASDMAHTAAEVLRLNGVDDVVTLLHCRLEDAELPEKVDVIISEWMGMSLFFESMWESVLVARDRWLKPGGAIMPSTVEMYGAPVELLDEWEEKVGGWKNVWGLDMSPLEAPAKEAYLVHPIFEETLEPRQLLTGGELLLTVDMSELESGDLNKFSHTWTVRMRRSGTVHGLTSWFVCLFEAAGMGGQNDATIEGGNGNGDSSSSSSSGGGGGGGGGGRLERLRDIIAALEASARKRQLESGAAASASAAAEDSPGGGAGHIHENRAVAAGDLDCGPWPSWASSWWLPRRSSAVSAEEPGDAPGGQAAIDRDTDEGTDEDAMEGVDVALDTSPLSLLTHWGHPLYVFDDPHPLAEGDELGVSFIMERNMLRQRHYHITVEASPSELPDPWYELKWFPLWQ